MAISTKTSDKPFETGLSSNENVNITSSTQQTNISSNLPSIMKSFPKQRGFKMAFLNIVSVTKNIDEIRYTYTMSDKMLDLFAFNETIDSTPLSMMAWSK